MSLAADWDALQQGLPEKWGVARLRLTVPDERDCARAAALLGPANPGRRGHVIRFEARRGAGPSPEMIRNLLSRIDKEWIRGEFELVRVDEAETTEEVERPTLVAAWDEAVTGLPPDWSDLYVELELVSSDWLERAALLLAPVNPARWKADARAKPARPEGGAASGALGEAPRFRFRVARRFGYGASPAMTRRCLQRVDEEGIRGEPRILRALSDTEPVATQGPVWYVEGRSV